MALSLDYNAGLTPENRERISRMSFGDRFRLLLQSYKATTDTHAAGPLAAGASGVYDRPEDIPGQVAWGNLGGPQLFAAATIAAKNDALATDRAVRNVEGAERTGAQRRRRRPSMLLDNLDEQSLLLGGVG